MGRRHWAFYVDDQSRLVRLSASKFEKLWDGERVLPGRAGQELKVLSMLVDVNQRTVNHVVASWAMRLPTKRDGTVDKILALRLGMGHEGSTDADAIRQLELDANSKWVPEDHHWSVVAKATKLSVDEVKRSLR